MARTYPPIKRVSIIHLLVLLGAILGGLLYAALTTTFPVDASRNSAGTYVLPPGNPIVTGTNISSTWANNTLSDIGVELTNSVDRNGRGGMNAPLLLTDGNAAAPALAFTSQTATGLYRAAISDARLSIAGVDRQQWTATNATIFNPLGINAASPHVTTPLFAIAQGFSMATTSRSGLNSRLVSNSYFNGTGDIYNAAGFAGLLDFPSFAQDFVFYTAPTGLAAGATAFTERFRIGVTGVTVANNATVNGNATVTGASTLTGGATIGASGTRISASFRGTSAWTPGSIGAGLCSSPPDIALTGTVAGADCLASYPTASSSTLVLQCTANANVCSIALCNPSAGAITGPVGTYACRVFNP